MKLGILLLLLLLIVACSYSLKYSGYTSPELAQHNTINLVKEVVHRHYPLVNISNVKPKIYWVDQDCLPFKNNCYGGLTFSCKEIYVANRSDRLSQTSLVHEIGHCLSLHVFKMMDQDHRNLEYWNLIRNINLTLAEDGY